MEAKPGLLLRFFRKVDWVFGWIAKFCAVICGIMLVSIAIIICSGVFTRSFTTINLLFVEEWSSLFLVPMAYLSFGYTLRQGKHFRVDLFIRKLSDKKQNILAIFSAVFSLVCLYYMIQFGIDRLGFTIERSVVSVGPMQTPLAPFAASMLFGICLFTVDMLCLLINKILELRQKGGVNAT